MKRSKIVLKIWLILISLTFLTSVSTKAQVTSTVGTGTVSLGVNGSFTPYFTNWTSNRSQYLITAAELTAAGFSGSRQITSLAFNVDLLGTGSSVCTGGTLNINQVLNFRINMKNSTLTNLSAWDLSGGFTQVLNPTAFTPVTGWNAHTLNTPFIWDGISNVIVEVCHDNTNGTATTCYAPSASSLATTTGFVSAIHYRADGLGALCASSTITSSGSNRPNMQFVHITPPPMLFVSSTTNQPNTSPVVPASTNQVILGVQVVTSGFGSPLVVNKLDFSTNGTTNTADISSAKVFYTGTSSSFSASTQFGSTQLAIGSNFSVTGSQALASGINYFWLVYDVSNTAVSNNLLDAECNQITYNTSTTAVPTVQAPVGTRIIRPSLNGSYSIGTGGDYTTLTAAVNELMVVGATGPVTFNLTNSYYGVSTGEVFPIIINRVPNLCGACNFATPILTIQPAASSSGVVIENLAANAQPLFNISGAQFVNFDGRIGGTGTSRSMILSNGNTANATLNITNDARQVTIRDCMIKSANTSTTSGAINIGGSTGTLGNDSIFIVNNAITNYAVATPTLANAIFSTGQSLAVQNDYIGILGNNIYNFINNGISVPATTSGNGAFWVISNNSFYDTLNSTSTAARVAINFTPSASATNSFGHQITNNFIGGTAPLCGGTPLTFTGAGGSLIGIVVSNSASTSPTLVNNNTITNIAMTGTGTRSLTGIQLSGPGTYTLTGNVLGHRTINNTLNSSNNGAINFIQSSGTGTITINNNVAANINMTNTGTGTAFRGIVSTSGSGIQTITGDSIYAITITGTATGSLTTAAFAGIAAIASPTTLNINNNFVNGITNLQTGAHCMLGISSTGSPTNLTYNNNTISNLRSLSTATGTTTTAAVNGLVVGGGTNVVVNGNIVNSLRAGGSAATQLNGVLISGGTSTVTNNTVTNLATISTSTLTTTSAALNGILGSTTSATNLTNNTVDSLTYSPATAAAVNMNGIYMAGSTNSVCSLNTVTRLLSRSTATGLHNLASMVGINIVSSGLNLNISRNTVHTLVNNNTTANPIIVGMYVSSSTSTASNTTTIARNLIHGLTIAATGTTGRLEGLNLGSGYGMVQNNMIRIGVLNDGSIQLGNFANKGIYLSGTSFGSAGNGLRIYHNTVYLAGSFNTGTNGSNALEFISNVIGQVDIRNNILVNASSNTTGTGFHQALRLANTVLTGISINNNIYFTPGTGGRLASIATTGYTTLTGAAGWCAATRFDGNSGVSNPGLINPTGNSSLFNLRLQSSNPAEAGGDPSVTVTDNFDGNSRGTRTPVDIGADAGTFTNSLDVNAPIISYTALANVFWFKQPNTNSHHHRWGWNSYERCQCAKGLF